MTMENDLPSEPKRTTGLIEIQQIDIRNTTKKGILDLIKMNFGNNKPVTLVCCESGIARSRYLARVLAKESAVDLCMDHYIDQDDEFTNVVQGAMIPLFEFELNENDQVRSDLDNRGLELLIICTNNKDAFKGDPRPDKYEVRRKNLIDKLERAGSKTRSDYVLKTMIIEGSEAQFLKVILGEEYDEYGCLL